MKINIQQFSVVCVSNVHSDFLKLFPAVQLLTSLERPKGATYTLTWTSNTQQDALFWLQRHSTNNNLRLSN